MGSGASKKKKQAEQLNVPVTVEAPPTISSQPGFAPPAFQTQYQATAPPLASSYPSIPAYPSIPVSPPVASSARPPVSDYQPQPGASNEEESPAILFDDGPHVQSSAVASDEPTGLFILDTVPLNGQWVYIPDESEVDMEPVMSHYVEKAFVRGLPAAEFKFQGNPCTVSFREMALTVSTSEGQQIYPVARKTEVHEQVLWMADDQTLRPLIPEAEQLVLQHRHQDVVFQMDNDLLTVSLSKGVVVDVTTGVERFLQVAE